MKIKTASWFTRLPPDHLQVGISRGVPRGIAAGYKKFVSLAPGAWFNSVTIPEYLERYNNLLAGLDAQQVAETLTKILPGKIPVMLCYENPQGINEGKIWCHRHLAAQWIEDKLGITVEEVGYPELDRFAKLRVAGVAPPRFL